MKKEFSDTSSDNIYLYTHRYRFRNMFICLHVEPTARHQVYLRLDQQRAVDATGEDLGHDVPVPEAPTKTVG